jgi:FxsC-like protein
VTDNRGIFAPYFFLSYARSDPLAGNPQENPDKLVERFFGDLVEAVRQRASRRAGLDPGFFDQQIPVGSDWKQRLSQALSTAQVFVPLYSIGYLTNSWPGREFTCFQRRVEQVGRVNPARWLVPVLWAPLAGVADPPGLREALDPGVAEPDYRENGLRALLKLRLYHDTYQTVVDHLAKQIVKVAEDDPLEPAQVPDIEQVESAFPPGGPVAVFVIEVAAPTLSTAPAGRDTRPYGETPAHWRPFPGQELSLAEYARQVAERFDFDARVTGLTGAGRRPGIIVIDPEYIADENSRAVLESVAMALPRWVLPLVVLGQPGDRRTRELAAQVMNILVRAKALPTESARQAASGVKSLDEFVSILPVLVAEAERQYLRYRSSRVPSPRSAGRPRLGRIDEPNGPATPDALGGREMPAAGAGQSRDAGLIVTFYSFKGGTGRTMALANVAWILAANGMRVLVADWDLESPGLHKFLQPFMDPGVSRRPGIIDFIRRYEWAAKEEGERLAALDTTDDESEQAARDAIARLIDKHVSQVSGYVEPVSWPFPGRGAIGRGPAIGGVAVHRAAPGSVTGPARAVLDRDGGAVPIGVRVRGEARRFR